MSAPPQAKTAPFWETKRLHEMNAQEWESLCDGCGLCCLIRYEDEETGEIIPTRVSCKLLDQHTCACKDYANRKRQVSDCVQLSPRNVKRIVWLPPTCAYRLVAEGKDLAWWHPLVSGSPETVHEAGVSVRGRETVCETKLPEEKWEERIVAWPGKVPRGAKAAK